MHSRLKFIVPLGLLFCFGCIDVPPVEPPPEGPPVSQPDGGGNPNPPVDQADFSLAVSPARVSVLQGKSQSLQLSLTRQGGFSGSVSVSAVNPPTGITVLPVTIPAGSTSANLDVSVGESAVPGAQVLTLKGTAGTLSRETAFELTVVRLGDLLVSWTNPSQDTVYVNGPLSLQVSVEGGTADYVEVLKGQTVLTRLSASPYQYTWDTTQTAEQTYTLTARAVRGSNTFTSTTTKTVVVDRTAPTVVSRTPSPGASNVSVKETLQVSFSEALKPSTVKDASVLVAVGSTNLAKTLSTSADGKALTVTPSAPLPVVSTVSLTLGTPTEPLTDLAGNAVAATTPWAFTVPAWLSMGGAISALSGNTPAENVTMKVGTDGVPVIAWSEFDGSVNNIHVRRWNGAAWGALGNPLSALAGTSTPANTPTLVLDGSNQPVVMWNEGANAYDSNLYGRKWIGTGWELLPGMPASTPSHSYDGLVQPQVVIDGRGKLAVAATANIAEFGTRVEVYSLNTTQDGWTPANPEVSDLAQSAEITMTADASSALNVAYLGSVDTGTEFYRGIVAQRLAQGGGWVRFGAPLRTVNAAREISMSMDGGGNPLVAWSDGPFEGPDRRVYAAWWSVGGWQQLGDVAGAHSTSNSKPSVVFGNDGKPLIAWSGTGAAERNIWVSRWGGSAWQLVGAPLSAVSGSSTAASSPVLALDKDGQPLVAWHESDGTVSNIYVYRYNH